jgi:hypothetical protein
MNVFHGSLRSLLNLTGQPLDFLYYLCMSDYCEARSGFKIPKVMQNATPSLFNDTMHQFESNRRGEERSLQLTRSLSDSILSIALRNVGPSGNF